jgi:NAD(P)H-dependent FMN reductase
MKINIISGSPRSISVTHRVAIMLEKELKKLNNVETSIIDVRDWNLPPIQNVFTNADVTPDNYKALFDKMNTADTFILVSPEYNGGYSPAMKNLLDHFPKSVYQRKAIGIVTASPGAFGGMRAAQQMQQLVCALFGIVSPHMLLIPQIDKKIDTEGNYSDEMLSKSIQNFINEYLWLAASLTK